METMSIDSEEMQRCIRECQNCHSVCVSMLANDCLSRGGKHLEATHVRTMLDCAQICATSADFMLRSSELHYLVCDACAKICTECARSCEELGGMQECVDSCRRCAETCRHMAHMPFAMQTR